MPGQARRKAEIQLPPIRNPALGGGWSGPRPGRFTPEKDPVPIVQEAVWNPGSVWTGAENLATTGIRSPDRPARSESLYRLSYRGRQLVIQLQFIYIIMTDNHNSHS